MKMQIKKRVRLVGIVYVSNLLIIESKIWAHGNVVVVCYLCTYVLRSCVL